MKVVIFFVFEVSFPRRLLGTGTGTGLWRCSSWNCLLPRQADVRFRHLQCVERSLLPCPVAMIVKG